MSNKTHHVLAGVAALTIGLASMTLSGPSFGAPPHPNQQTAQQMTTTQIKSVQEALTKAGYDVKADGVWGAQSSDALMKFQSKNGLPATGNPDQKTRQALGLNW